MREADSRPMGPRPISVMLLSLVGAVGTFGCGSPYSTFGTGGPDAGSIAGLTWFLIALMGALVLGMGGLVLYAALRRRGTLAEHEPFDIGGGHAWVLIGGFGLPAAIVSILFVLTLVGMPTTAESENPPADLEIDVQANQWWWQFRYRDPTLQRWFTTANEMHIPVGSRVRINLRSGDVIHSFWVPKLHGKLDAIPGRTNHLILQADEPGVYRGECAEYCGAQHTHMRFLVVAEDPEEYERWAEQQRQPAPAPENSQERRGQRLFLGTACAYCHTIRGTQAQGMVGPDLTHVASRRTLAAGTLPNNRGHLQAWIVNARALKPGVRMPPMLHFDGEELNAIATYLQSLE